MCVCVCLTGAVGEKGKVKLSYCLRGALANVGVLCVCVFGVKVWRGLFDEVLSGC